MATCKHCNNRLFDMISDLKQIRHLCCIGCGSTFASMDSPRGVILLMDVTELVDYLEVHVWSPTMQSIAKDYKNLLAGRTEH